MHTFIFILPVFNWVIENWLWSTRAFRHTWIGISKHLLGSDPVFSTIVAHTCWQTGSSFSWNTISKPLWTLLPILLFTAASGSGTNFTMAGGFKLARWRPQYNRILWHAGFLWWYIWRYPDGTSIIIHQLQSMSNTTQHHFMHYSSFQRLEQFIRLPLNFNRHVWKCMQCIMITMTLQKQFPDHRAYHYEKIQPAATEDINILQGLVLYILTHHLQPITDTSMLCLYD